MSRMKLLEMSVFRTTPCVLRSHVNALIGVLQMIISARAADLMASDGAKSSQCRAASGKLHCLATCLQERHDQLGRT